MTAQSPPDWPNLILSRLVSDPPSLDAVTYFRTFQSASSPVEVGCSDGHRYVVKALRNNAQIGRWIFNDQVAGRLAALLGAPVPKIVLVDIPQDLINVNGGMSHLVAGTAHGSRALSDVSERINDITQIADNRTRFAALTVFFGWMLANDRQFLYQNSTPQLVYSVDHGHFFQGGPDWTEASLQTAPSAQIAGDLATACGFTRQELEPPISALDAITCDQLAETLAKPPDGWGVDLSGRAALAAYLWKRRSELITAFAAVL